MAGFAGVVADRLPSLRRSELGNAPRHTKEQAIAARGGDGEIDIGSVLRRPGSRNARLDFESRDQVYI
jgi:hypothetical protein